MPLLVGPALSSFAIVIFVITFGHDVFGSVSVIEGLLVRSVVIDGVLTHMGLLMALEVEVCVEALVAVTTGKPLNTSMDLYVLVKISPLGKAVSTVREIADIGSLISMDPQMVKEVVPLAEPLVAFLVITFEYLDESFRLRILVCKDPKAFCIRNVLFDLNRP